MSGLYLGAQEGPLLRGRHVVVTGGSRGLGEQVVRHAAAAGAQVSLCGRNKGSLTGLCDALVTEGLPRPFTRAVDVTVPEELERFVDESVGEHGRLDGAVACAGGARGGALEVARPADWAMTWALNVGHAAGLAAATASHMRASGGGSLVLISSISGWKPGPQAQYGAAKAAQIHLASSLARELDPAGIRVNAVSPGSMLIRGKRWDRMRQEKPEVFDRFLDEMPGRVLVSPQEVAEVVLFLLPEHSRGVSGANIPVDRAQNAPTPEGY